MSVNDNSTSSEIQRAGDESTQATTTKILHQDAKNDDVVLASGNHDKPKPQPTTHDSSQTATIHAMTVSAHDSENPSLQEVPATTHASDQTASIPGIPTATHEVNQTATTGATVVSTREPGNSSPLEVPTTIHESDRTATIRDTMVSTNDPGITTTTLETAATDAMAVSTHDNSSPPEVLSTTHESDQTATTDATAVSTPDPGKSSSLEGQPTTDESNQTATTDAMAVSADDPGKSSSPQVPTTTRDSTEKPVTEILDSDTLGNSSSPKVEATDKEPTSTGIAEVDTSVTNATTIPAIDNRNSSAPEIQPTADRPTQTASTDSNTNNGVSAVPPGPDQERNHLENLIDQELKFIENNYEKLSKHQEHIHIEAQEALNKFRKLKVEHGELKELKDLKKTVTKLKLQIPAKYRTYDENDPQKNQQSDGSAGKKAVIPAKLLKQMPQLHSKMFHSSPFCRTIQQRYNDLEPALKLCLLCFSAFPENAIISRRSMVYWWIGEGLAEEFEGGKSAEEFANEFFNQLMDKDFIEPVSNRKRGRNVAACKMHPLIRASLVMIADEVNFFDFDEYGTPKDFGKFDEIESPEEMPVIYPLGDPREFFDFFDKKRVETTETIVFSDEKGNPTKFADFHPNENIDPPLDSDGKPIGKLEKYYFYKRKKITTKSYSICLMGNGMSRGLVWEKLHMLFNVKDDILEFKPEWFLRMKNVNVVFLGRWQSTAAHHIELEDFKIEESLSNMNHLRFFSLQGVSRISELPKSISSLERLLILDLRACHNLEVIPRTIGSLKCLTHLDMSECYLLERLPKELSSLESLQVLKGFIVVENLGKSACTLFDLAKLRNLKKLSLYTHMKNFPQERHLEALDKFEVLSKLTIEWGGHDSNAKLDVHTPVTVSQKRDENLMSRCMKCIPTKPQVQGIFQRMDAWKRSTLGSRLQKLDLKCFPDNTMRNWLTPGYMTGLKKLYIRGGQLSDLGQYQDVYDWDAKDAEVKKTWNVEILRLKYLDEIEMDWSELQSLFPKMTSLEKVKCPKLTFFPCNESGVWTKTNTNTSN